jgi:AraC-like DNA-binding protein
MAPLILIPPKDLAAFVDYFWILERDQGGADITVEVFATEVSGIIFQHHDGHSAWRRSTARAPYLGTSFVHGKRTQPTRILAKACFGVTGVVFKPQGLSMLLKVAPALLTNSPVELNEFSRDRVGEQLLDARSQGKRIARLIAFLRRQANSAQPEDVLVSASLRLIHRHIRTIRVSHLCRSLHVSERQFERRFIRTIGVSPRCYIRIARFQKALSLMRGQFERLSDIAYDLDYADQSHFIKDMKDLSGCTPKALAATVRASIPLPCAVIPLRRE